MKNQYFGDINDYLKYGLLRMIGQVTGLQLAVCWMLTPKDDRRDGGKTAYLNAPEKWRRYDLELFDTLQQAVDQNCRAVQVAHEMNIVPAAGYFSQDLQDGISSRTAFFMGMEYAAAASALVFFDPDNGMEVKSKPKGRKDSSKYLYWDEVRRFSDLGKSLIVFQHFAREKRDVHIDRLQQRFKTECGGRWVGVLRTSNVAYFVVPAPAHEKALQAACQAVCTAWQPHIWLHV